MGCDIHLYTESKINGVWYSDDSIRFDPYGEGEDYLGITYDEQFYKGRDYILFDTLAGVRGGGLYQKFEVKGLPSNISTPIKNMYNYWGRDAHTPSYITISELEEYLSHDFRLDIDVVYKNMSNWIDDLTECTDGEFQDSGICLIETTRKVVQEMEEFVDGKGLDEDEIKVYNQIEQWVDILRGFTGDDHRLVFWFDN